MFLFLLEEGSTTIITSHFMCDCIVWSAVKVAEEYLKSILFDFLCIALKNLVMYLYRKNAKRGL